MVVSLISVFESGLPPFGGSAAPPKTLVRRLMKVLLPQPESAARPITTVFASAEHETVKARFWPRKNWFLFVLVKNMTCLWCKCGLGIEREGVVYTVHAMVLILNWVLVLVFLLSS